jgi:hypothetical protein
MFPPPAYLPPSLDAIDRILTLFILNATEWHLFATVKLLQFNDALGRVCLPRNDTSGGGGGV